MTVIQPHYATLAQIRTETKVKSTSTADDSYLLDAIDWVSARIDHYLGYQFAPEIATRYYNAVGKHIVPHYRLWLDRPLLSATTIVDAENTTLTAWDGTYANRSSANYTTHPYGDTPIWALEKMLTSTTQTWVYAADWQKAISITGVWGYHSDYANAWISSGDTVQDAPLSSSATSVTVSNADGADVLNRTPRFSAGNLIKIESEYIQVIATNTSTNVLTVIRGVRGSTAASHVATTAISVWQPEFDIQRAALRWVGYLYSRRAAFEQSQFDAVGAITKFPPDMPEEVAAILDQPQYGRLLK